MWYLRILKAILFIALLPFLGLLNLAELIRKKYFEDPQEKREDEEAGDIAHKIFSRRRSAGRFRKIRISFGKSVPCKFCGQSIRWEKRNSKWTSKWIPLNPDGSIHRYRTCRY